MKIVSDIVMTLVVVTYIVCTCFKSKSLYNAPVNKWDRFSGQRTFQSEKQDLERTAGITETFAFEGNDIRHQEAQNKIEIRKISRYMILSSEFSHALAGPWQRNALPAGFIVHYGRIRK